jgi:hypothetical protein
VVNGGPTVDVAGCRGGSIADDLGQRDFTINAIAMPLDGGDAIDPYGGRDDLRAERIRLVSSQVFDDDPLRLLRLGRIAHELGFVIDAPARGRARERAALADRPSGERIFMEMRRILLLDDPADGIRILDDLDVLEVVLPELAPTRGVEQSGHHHLDVFEHTLQVLDTVADIADNPEHYLGEHAAAVAEELARPVGDGLDEAGVLRLPSVPAAGCSCASTCDWASWCGSGRSTGGRRTATCGPPIPIRSRASSCHWPTVLPPAGAGPASGTCGRMPRPRSRRSG